MNADQLLDHYEQIVDASEAIPSLRRFILDLAVRGKLVPQDTKDKVKKYYAGEPSVNSLPANWQVLNFGKFCNILGGDQPPKNQFVDEARDGYVRLYQIRDLGKNPIPVYIPQTSTKRFCKQGDILIGRYGASIGKIFWAQDGAYNVALAKFVYPETALVASFAFLLLNSEIFQGKLRGVTRSAQAGFNKGDLASLNFPLPPLAEQHRIVAKVDELMALCDRLEAARTERETTRTRLAKASFARLNAPDPDQATFQKHATFALDNLTPLTTRPNQIKALRQTILNLAVHGKLVPQNPNDEPASELLKRIEAEKARLVKEEKIKKLKVIPALAEQDLPCQLPANWRWSQIAEIGLLKPRNDVADDVEASFIPMPMIPDDYGIACRHEIRRWGEIKRGYTHFAEGDVGLAKITPCFQNRKSTVLRNLTNGLGSGSTELHIVRPLFIDPDFIVIFFKCSYFIETGILKMTGTAGQKRVPTAYFAHSPFPLPPLAEQHRIVAKVGELMALCDQLEASLSASDASRSRLLDTLLYKAVESNGKR